MKSKVTFNLTHRKHRFICVLSKDKKWNIYLCKEGIKSLVHLVPCQLSPTPKKKQYKLLYCQWGDRHEK